MTFFIDREGNLASVFAGPLTPAMLQERLDEIKIRHTVPHIRSQTDRVHGERLHGPVSESGGSRDDTIPTTAKRFVGQPTTLVISHVALQGVGKSTYRGSLDRDIQTDDAISREIGELWYNTRAAQSSLIGLAFP